MNLAIYEDRLALQKYRTSQDSNLKHPDERPIP